jgi:15-cis-phytoene synthase
MESNKNKIFKTGSRTYFYSSWFFPPYIRSQVSTLYAFVRTVDDYVDSQPQKKEEFIEFYQTFKKAWLGDYSNNNLIINDFVRLAKNKGFLLDWIEAFFSAMRSDLEKQKYFTIKETVDYMYGSAEVIGLMMAKIMNLKTESYQGARMLGRSMQYINFIRDLDEDNKLGRQYLPINEMKNMNLNNLNKEEVMAKKYEFINFLNQQIKYYNKWQKEAELAFKFIPIRYQIPIATASAMYNYTARQIEKNPLIVFKKKVKPSKIYILLNGLKISFKLLWKKFF